MGRAWLAPADDHLRRLLCMPQLALVAESCDAERRLHAALQAAPSQPVAEDTLEALADADVRDNYRHVLAFRDRLLRAGSFEACYLGLMRGGPITLPPVFVEYLATAIVAHLMEGTDDAFEARAADLLVRPQCITTQGGQRLAADRETVEQHAADGGFGALGRLLRQGDVPWRSLDLAVLGADNTAAFWQARNTAARHRFVLDLTHEVVSEVGHGVAFTLTRARSGSKALAWVLERWVAHFLGVAVHIEPLQAINDSGWRWHIGLDAEATAILNALYEGADLPPERLQPLIGLFRLRFADPREMRADIAGKPVYLGLAHNADGVLTLKPQNLLLNLPLARSM